MRLLSLLVTPLILQLPLSGAGFQLSERSVKGLGRAFSGEAAIGDGASIPGSNPAGMSLLDNWSFEFGTHYLSPEVWADGAGVTGPINDSRVVSDSFIPYSYLTTKVNDRLSLGLGVYTTFGMDIDYATDFATGASVNENRILTFNINPAFSYRLNDQWSIGAGFDALYAEGTLNSLRPGVGTNLFDLTGDDWGYGYNLGILYEPCPGTRFGIHYRSSIDLKIKGRADIGAGFGAFPPGIYPTSLDVELPDSLEISAYHEINDQWAVHADFVWTNWSLFQSLEPEVHPALDPELAKEQNWSDTIRIAIGTTYRHSERLTFRAGLAFDESPVNDSNRTLRIPDDDRIWASIGATYQINKCF
ncbi:MAG: OmpP1/FadL family transporter [Akkermansiaceae bacterium]